METIKNYITERITRTKIVVFIVSILLVAGAVIFALDPAKQLERLRNDQRRSDATQILEALNQYSIDNGKLPAELPQNPKEICKQSGACEGLVDLKSLVDSKKYLSSIPVDPKNKSENGSGYQISRSESGRITISVINPEGGAVISVTR